MAVSHVQMARYLAASEFALREAMAPQATMPEKKTTRYYTWDQRAFFGKIHLQGPVNRRTFPLVGLELQRDLMDEKNSTRNLLRLQTGRDPARKEQEAMAVVVSTYEPTEIRFSEFRAPVTGKYKLKFSAYSVWMAPKFASVSGGRRPEPVTIYAGGQSAPQLAKARQLRRQS